MQSTMFNQKATAPAGLGMSRRQPTRMPSRLVARAAGDDKESTAQGQDSYSRIEAPVRGDTPDAKLYGGKSVQERNWGQDQLNPELRANTADPSKRVGEFAPSEAMRFTGAIPEIANCRLAMLGVVAALGAEIATGKNVFEQYQMARVPIIATFFLFTLATAVPVFRGQPRTGNGIFSSDAELYNGRIAMVGFLGLIISTFYTGRALFFL